MRTLSNIPLLGAMLCSYFLSPALAQHNVTLDEVIPGPGSSNFTQPDAVDAPRAYLEQLSLVKMTPVINLSKPSSSQAASHAVDLVNHNVWVLASATKEVYIYSFDSTGELTLNTSIHFNPIKLSDDYIPRSITLSQAGSLGVIGLDAGDGDSTTSFMFIGVEANSYYTSTSKMFGVKNALKFTFNPQETCMYGTGMATEGGYVGQWCTLNETTDFFSDGYLSTDFYFKDDLELTTEAIEVIKTQGGYQSDDSLNLIDDLQPSTVTFSSTVDENGRREMYVNCQKNNLIVVFSVDDASELGSMQFERIQLLGYKDLSLSGNGADVVNDGNINITTVNALAINQPIALQHITQNDVDYIITANTGAPGASSTSEEFLSNANGEFLSKRTTIASNPPIPNRDFVFGGRSISVYNAATGDLVFDSGSLIEEMVAEFAPEYFNSVNGVKGDVDASSGSIGPGPISMTVGNVNGKELLFVALSGVELIAMWDITDVKNPVFLSINGLEYLDGKEETVTTTESKMLTFVEANCSPNSKNLLIATGSESSTVAVFEVRDPVPGNNGSVCSGATMNLSLASCSLLLVSLVTFKQLF